MLALLKKLTVDQWRAIDDEYLVDKPSKHRVYAILVFACVSLLLNKYVGATRFIQQIDGAKELFATLPYPSLWPRLYWAAAKLVSYVLVPVLCIKLVLRERVWDYGIGMSRYRIAYPIYAAMLGVVVPLAYAVSHSASFLKAYPKYRQAGDSLTQLLLWEGAYAAQFAMLEFFFRGFLVFSLARHLGATAIFVAVVPYVMIHFQKPPLEAVASVVAGIALGTMALRTKSIHGGIVVHVGVAWAMDIFALLRKGGISL